MSRRGFIYSARLVSPLLPRRRVGLFPLSQVRRFASARQGGQCADDEEQRPARTLGNETCPGRQVGPPDGGERGEQCVLRRRMQRVVAERREVSDEDHGPDGAGKVLHDDRQRQCPKQTRD